MLSYLCIGLFSVLYFQRREPCCTEDCKDCRLCPGDELAAIKSKWKKTCLTSILIVTYLCPSLNGYAIYNISNNVTMSDISENKETITLALFR